MASKVPIGLMLWSATRLLRTPHGQKSLHYLNSLPPVISRSPRQRMTLSCTPSSKTLHPRCSLSTHHAAGSLSSEAKGSGIYSGDLPDNLATDPRLKSFYEVFYNVADNSDAHEAYAEAFFTKDATFILGSRKAQGHNKICDLRRSMWSGPIKSRQHTLLKIFPFGNHSSEIMIYGTCVYNLWNGKSIPLDWAARASLEDEGRDLKMRYYQVYVDSVLIANAAKDD